MVMMMMMLLWIVACGQHRCFLFFYSMLSPDTAHVPHSSWMSTTSVRMCCYFLFFFQYISATLAFAWENSNKNAFFSAPPNAGADRTGCACTMHTQTQTMVVRQFAFHSIERCGEALPFDHLPIELIMSDIEIRCCSFIMFFFSPMARQMNIHLCAIAAIVGVDRSLIKRSFIVAQFFFSFSFFVLHSLYCTNKKKWNLSFSDRWVGFYFSFFPRIICWLLFGDVEWGLVPCLIDTTIPLTMPFWYRKRQRERERLQNEEKNI